MEDVKKMLLTEKEALIEEINKVKVTTFKDHEVGDIIDNSVEGQERDLSLLLKDREMEKLEKIEDALRRMDTGDYGMCEECDEQIAKNRLKAVPFARLCVACKQEEEKYHHAKGSTRGDEAPSRLMANDE